MSTNGNGGSPGPAGQAGTNVAVPDTIDFVYEVGTDGNIAPNQIVRGEDDYTLVDGDPQTDTNEVMEVFKVEIDPAEDTTTTPNSLSTVDSIRLWNGDSYYDHVRFREFQSRLFGPTENNSTPMLGQPVLAGTNNPASDPIGTATPKYGPSETITPAIINDGTAISEGTFTIRFHVYRWKGSNAEFVDFFNDVYGRTSFQQNISFSNPYTGESQTYTRSDPANIAEGTSESTLGAFTKLAGGVNQSLPKVYPWVTHAENGNDTRPNREYEFTTRNGNVANQYERLEFDYTDRENAVLFEHIAVQQNSDLDSGTFVVEERDEDPDVNLGSGVRHELPLLRDPDDTSTVEEFDAGQVPVSVADRFNSKQAIWSDGGGFRVMDDGTSIPAGDILIGVHGRKLELTT